ncbi:MAG: hypothetical protein AAFX09_06535 [Pseudomonadota bacterium]
MARVFAGIASGFVVSILLIMAIQQLGHLIYPPPEGVDMRDPDALTAMMKSLPLGSKLFVIGAWFTGVLAGGYVAGRIARRVWAAWTIAGVTIIFAILNFMMIPHPIWMIAGGLVLIVLAGWLAGRLSGAKAA